MTSEIWNLVLSNIRENENSNYVMAFMNLIRPVSLKEDKIVLEVPGAFHKEYIEQHFYDILFRNIKSALNVRADIKLVVNKDLAAIQGDELPLNGHANGHHVAIDAQTGIPALKLPSEPKGIALGNLYPKFTFDNFVVGKSNEFSYAASMVCSENPGMKYNPLFIAAGSGLGKTHLLNAIGHGVKMKQPNARIFFLSAEKFTNEVIAAIRTQNTAEFRKKYRDNCDVLLMDDIQFLSGKTSTMEEFFHTFNTLYDARKQIVVTSDKQPQEIDGFQERLLSRFAWGLVADIQPPEIETRIAILSKKAEQEGVILPMDVATYVASCVRSNVRELEGALCRVIAFSDFRGVAITVELAKECLKSIVRGSEDKLGVEDVQKIVSEFYKVSVADLRSSSRKREFVVPRQVAMYLARKQLGLSFPQIGAGFGGKDHTTVMFACNKIEQEIEKGAEIGGDIVQLIKRLVL